MPKDRISFKVSRKAKKALKVLATEGPQPPQFQVVGKVRRGQLQIDSKKLADFTKKIPKNVVWFVALNAPFKTRALTSSV